MKSIVLQNNTKTKVVAAVAAVSMLMWALGLPAWINSSRAAGITDISDTLSDSAPTVNSQHTVAYTSTTAVAAGETIKIAFADVWTIPTFDAADDFTGTTGLTVVASGGCTAAASEAEFSSSDTGGDKHVTFTVCTGDTVSAGAISIVIGASGAATVDQITNPAVGSYEISVEGTQTDNGKTRVYIIDNISMTATVPTTFNFYIEAVNSGIASPNGEATVGTTSVTTTSTTIPWGTITPDDTLGTDAKVAAHTLEVGTNATNGFVVTLEQDQDLTSSANDTIDLFKDNAATATPEAWAQPTSVLDDTDTYGHYGVTSEDSDLNTDEFGVALYAGNLTAPRQVFSHTGPADGDGLGGGTADKGLTRVGYKIEITALQEAGDDYSNTLTYIATPTF